MTSLDIAPIQAAPVSATEQVFSALYDAIVSVKLPPGSKVSETEIAKQLDVSRQPVRDAFFRLSNLNFLSIRPQRATLVTQISLQAVSNAVFTRIALETACLRQAMKVAPDTLAARLQASVAEQSAVPAGDQPGFHASDEVFHETICNVAQHGHIWRLIRDQKAHMDRIRFLTLSDARRAMVIEEHQGIIDAVRSGNALDAEDRLRAHIAAVEDVAAEIQKRHPDYFEPARPSGLTRA